MIDAGGIWQGGGHHVGEVLGVQHVFIVDPLSPLCCDKPGCVAGFDLTTHRNTEKLCRMGVRLRPIRSPPPGL